MCVKHAQIKIIVEKDKYTIPIVLQPHEHWKSHKTQSKFTGPKIQINLIKLFMFGVKMNHIRLIESYQLIMIPGVDVKV